MRSLASSSVPSLRAAAAALSLCALVAAQSGGSPSQGTDSGKESGFIKGLRGFESFHEPIGQPIYFESPFNDTGLRAIYLKHDFSNGSQLQGGDLTVYALQARLAITERLAFIATKDGYSDLDAGIVSDTGWNDIAAGFKYVVLADRDDGFVLTPGIRYQASNGNREVLQGNVEELSPFVSFGKGWDRLHLLGNVTLRVPFDGDKGNTVLHWDAHVDYDLNPGQDVVVAPTVEVHGVHYLDNGTSPLTVGGLDYANLGSQVSGDFVGWIGVGARVEIKQNFEFGAVYEFAFTDPDDDIMDQRITIDFIVRF